jgi:hypothetical protein
MLAAQPARADTDNANIKNNAIFFILFSSGGAFNPALKN